MNSLHEQLDQVQSPSTPIPRMTFEHHPLLRRDSPPTPEPTALIQTINNNGTPPPGSALTTEDAERQRQ
ncbi:hypothetical protein O0I10_000547 [Lichtheimia ornata]|uniref:Uncharacterized protein n=1 Tax=Lichtheimia ornata TaxID=688661 RepID=A0AAD7Y3V4_9FUNG|nr:uncharacterized protein O0I10_000547 [Lichtheimia ornata]KAJ8663308.1 hypothetical protein O0I10_000547 [Lichtheimia ornata]